MSFVSPEAMERDLKGSNGKAPGRKNPLYDQIIEKVQQITDKPLAVELTPSQRTGLLNKLKKMELLVTRSDPKRPYQAKHKILERDAKGKPKSVRIYFFKNA